jgi:hypothetical protein
MPEGRLVRSPCDRDRSPCDQPSQGVRAMRLASGLGGEPITVGLGRSLVSDVQGLHEVVAVHCDLLWDPGGVSRLAGATIGRRPVRQLIGQV